MTAPQNATPRTFDRKTPKGSITREQLEADLEGFRERGGQIEKLGTTTVLHKLQTATTPTTAGRPAHPQRQGRSSESRK